MSEPKPVSSPSGTPATASPGGEVPLEVLHERVNQMLEAPLPKEGDAWPLPVEETIAAQPPA